MKLSDIDKLYKKLSPEQSGVMAFEAIARAEDHECYLYTDLFQQIDTSAVENLG
jgi:hypothetical protein